MRVLARDDEQPLQSRCPGSPRVLLFVADPATGTTEVTLYGGAGVLHSGSMLCAAGAVVSAFPREVNS